MAVKTNIQNKTQSTVKYLRDQGLLTKEHDLLIALLTELVNEWGEAKNSTQRSLLSKEIRAALEMLPTPEVKPTDAAQDFLNSLTGDEK